MKDHAMYSAESELFNEHALLALMDGNRDDAKAILESGVAEMHEIIKRLECGIHSRDMAGIMLASSSAKGIADIMCSSTLRESLCQISRMAFLRNIDETRLAILALRGGLKLLELHLRRESWL